VEASLPRQSIAVTLTTKNKYIQKPKQNINLRQTYPNQEKPVTALHQGAPGQITWLEDPPSWRKPWRKPCLLLCFASLIVRTENKNFTISDRWPLYLFYFDSETISAVVNFFWGKKVRSADLARGCSDLEMTWLLCCARAPLRKTCTNSVSHTTIPKLTVIRTAHVNAPYDCAQNSTELFW